MKPQLRAVVAAVLVQRMTAGTWCLGPLGAVPSRFALGLLAGVGGIVTAFLLLPAAWLAGSSMVGLNWSALAGYPRSVGLALVQAGPHWATHSHSYPGRRVTRQHESSVSPRPTAGPQRSRRGAVVAPDFSS
jgi:hypothetical protein